MSLIEHELRESISVWRSKPRLQVIEEISSLSLESRRIPDPYFFDFDKVTGKLISPQTGCLVEDSVQNDTPLQKAEFQALLEIQAFVTDSDSGKSFWISPPFPGVYPTAKLIVSEIETSGQNKRLFNRAILFDGNSEICHQMAKILTEDGDSFEIQNLRSTPIFWSGEVDTDWLTLVEEFLLEESQPEQIRNGTDFQEKQVTLKFSGMLYDKLILSAGFDDGEIKKEVATGMFGNFSISCPHMVTPINRFKENSDKSAFVRKCPYCKKSIMRVISKGFHCSCGETYLGIC